MSSLDPPTAENLSRDVNQWLTDHHSEQIQTWWERTGDTLSQADHPPTDLWRTHISSMSDYEDRRQRLLKAIDTPAFQQGAEMPPDLAELSRVTLESELYNGMRHHEGFKLKDQRIAARREMEKNPRLRPIQTELLRRGLSQSLSPRTTTRTPTLTQSILHEMQRQHTVVSDIDNWWDNAEESFQMDHSHSHTDKWHERVGEMGSTAFETRRRDLWMAIQDEHYLRTGELADDLKKLQGITIESELYNLRDQKPFKTRAQRRSAYVVEITRRPEYRDIQTQLLMHGLSRSCGSCNSSWRYPTTRIPTAPTSPVAPSYSRTALRHTKNWHERVRGMDYSSRRKDLLSKIGSRRRYRETETWIPSSHVEDVKDVEKLRNITLESQLYQMRHLPELNDREKRVAAYHEIKTNSDLRPLQMMLLEHGLSETCGCESTNQSVRSSHTVPSTIPTTSLQRADSQRRTDTRGRETYSGRQSGFSAATPTTRFAIPTGSFGHPSNSAISVY